MCNNSFGELFVRGKSPKVSVFGADLYQQWHDSISFHEFINPPHRQRGFSKIVEAICTYHQLEVTAIYLKF
jgi:hypothetical protein